MVVSHKIKPTTVIWSLIYIFNLVLYLKIIGSSRHRHDNVE